MPNDPKKVPRDSGRAAETFLIAGIDHHDENVGIRDPRRTTPVPTASPVSTYEQPALRRHIHPPDAAPGLRYRLGPSNGGPHAWLGHDGTRERNSGELRIAWRSPPALMVWDESACTNALPPLGSGFLPNSAQ